MWITVVPDCIRWHIERAQGPVRGLLAGSKSLQLQRRLRMQLHQVSGNLIREKVAWYFY